MINCNLQDNGPAQEVCPDIAPFCIPQSLFQPGLDIADDGCCYLSGTSLPAFTHCGENTLSDYRRNVEGRTNIRFTQIIIDPENGCISIILDDSDHLSNERGITINDHRFLFEIRYWLFSKTGLPEFLYVEYAEQGAQSPEQLELEYCGTNYD